VQLVACNALLGSAAILKSRQAKGKGRSVNISSELFDIQRLTRD
jgi:hypothetical protein